MIIPSIDLERGRAVQLIGGEQLAIDAGDPRPLLKRFSMVGEVALVDLDGAKGLGDNVSLMSELCRSAQVRVGGGIRDVQTARRWLDLGAAKIVVATAATPEFLAQLPKERVIVALDERDGRVLTHGWRTTSGNRVEQRIADLRQLCGGFLITFVNREGRLGGTDLERAALYIELAGDTRVTIAGGITQASEIAELDVLGADAQVGMALYSGRLSLAQAVASVLTSDRSDGLWPTVVVDENSKALGLAYSDLQSLSAALDQGRGIYHSRKRGFWTKGESSGDTQELIAVDLDCDRDTLRFTVRQPGTGFCHLGTRTCWGADRGFTRLQGRIANLLAQAPEDSNTVRLARDAGLLRSKLVEEAEELGLAQTRVEATHEAADLIYFALVKATLASASLADVERELDRRELRVNRRSCEAKPIGSLSDSATPAS